MPLTCNIDSKGKAVRLIWGLLLIVAAVLVAALWAARGDAGVPWALAGALAVGGAFAVFEARAGWCVVRAMGSKTPICSPPRSRSGRRPSRYRPGRRELRLLLLFLLAGLGRRFGAGLLDRHDDGHRLRVDLQG